MNEIKDSPKEEIRSLYPKLQKGYMKDIRNIKSENPTTESRNHSISNSSDSDSLENPKSLGGSLKRLKPWERRGSLRNIKSGQEAEMKKVLTLMVERMAGLEKCLDKIAETGQGKSI